MIPEKETLPPSIPDPEHSPGSTGENPVGPILERRKRLRKEKEETPQDALDKIIELDRGHNYLGQVDRYLVSSPKDRDHAYQGLMINVEVINQNIERTASPTQKEKLTQLKEF